MQLQIPYYRHLLTFLVSFTFSSHLAGYQEVDQGIVDPYLWLEDMDSPRTQAYVASQNAKTDSFFSDHLTLEALKSQMIKIVDVDQMGIPQQKGDRLFYTLRLKGENQKKLVSRSLDGSEETLVDPNILDPTGKISITNFSISKNGRYLAYGLSQSGGDAENWSIIDLETGIVSTDIIRDIKFVAPVFSDDGQSIFYTRFLADRDNSYALLKQGIDEKEEKATLLYITEPKKQCMIMEPHVVLEGKAILFYIRQGVSKNNGVYLYFLESQEVKEVIPAGIEKQIFIHDRDKKLFFITTENASRNRLVSIDIANGGITEEVIAESEDCLTGAIFASDYLVCSYLHDCKSLIRVYKTNGEYVHDLVFDTDIGTVAITESSSDTFYLSFTNFISPQSIYKHEIDRCSTELFFSPSLGWYTDGYITKQYFYSSKDGTSIPLFITYKRGLKLTGKTPTLLYGYGGFNISLPPNFSPLAFAWVEGGGIYVSANLRGGGEYGPEWYNAGRRFNKQNVFDDFIAAAEWLIKEGYTTSQNLAITGRSNGGLLVGACMIQRPDLFAAAVPQVGVLDMLRFHKFTIGWAWMCDYGNPEVAEDRDYLMRYSPYHNLKEGVSYPSTLVTTADHDDRVVPLHSYKFAGRLQECHVGKGPVLLRVYTNTGHGAGRSLGAQVQEFADVLYFLQRTTK
jgi:prolyl oligopeptidase